MKATVEYIKKSEYRRKVLKTLANDTKIPSQIAKDTGIVQSVAWTSYGWFEPFLAGYGTEYPCAHSPIS